MPALSLSIICFVIETTSFEFILKEAVISPSTVLIVQPSLTAGDDVLLADTAVLAPDLGALVEDVVTWGAEMGLFSS